MKSFSFIQFFLSKNSLISLLDRKEKFRFFFIIFSLLIFNLFSLFGLALLLPFLGLLVEAKTFVHKEPFVSILQTLHLPQEEFYLILIASSTYLVLLLTRTLLNIWTNHLLFRFSSQVMEKKTDTLHQHYLHLDYLTYSKRNTGSLVKNCTKTMEYVGLAYHTYLQFISTGMTTIFLTSLALYKNPWVALGLFTTFGLIGVSLHFGFKRRLIKSGKVRENAFDDMHRLCSESFLSFREIRLMGAFDFFKTRLQKKVLPCTRAIESQYFYPSIPQIIAEFALVFVSIFVVLTAIYKQIPLENLIQELIFYLALAKWLLPAVMQSLSHRIRLSACYPSVQTILQELNTPLDEKELAYQAHPQQKNFQDRLLAKNISFSYESNAPLLKNVSFTIYENQTHAFVGPSGSGKSTLMDLLTGLLTPHEGSFEMGGKSFQHLCFLRQTMGYVPQMVNLLDDSILHNVAFGEENPNEEKVMEALEMAHLTSFVSSLEKGIHQIIGERGTRLSGGQRQRIGIARALYKDPKILIFDEATSSLDNLSEKAIGDTIEKLSGQKTLIVVAHRLSTIKDFQHIHVMKQGQIIACGNHENLLKTCPDYQKLNLLHYKNPQEEKTVAPSHSP